MTQIINSDKYSYSNRSSSHATKASARGVNLLGWEKDEEMSLEDQRGALLKRNEFLRKSADEESDPSLKKDINKEYTENNRKINEIKKKMGLCRVPNKVRERELQNYILDVVKERVTKPQWKAYVNEGIRRLEEDKLQ